MGESAGREYGGGIISKFKSAKNITHNIFETPFNTGVAPIMDYCAGVWGYYDSDAINNVQNRAMRYFWGVNKFTPTHALHGELGWVMPKYRSWLSCAQLWNRLILMNDNRSNYKEDISLG